tara:strand:+ start:9591 stop:10589 length:999 start_codon:yes stop_codon:yes gene_type:complete
MRPNKILIRMPNWLGDCVMALPLLESLRIKFPEVVIDLAIPADYVSIASLLPCVSTAYPLDKKHSQQRKMTLRMLLDGEYDLLIILPNSFRSAWELFTRNIPTRLGYAGELRSILLTNSPTKTVKHSLHQSDYYMKLIQHLYPDIPTTKVRVNIPTTAVDSANKLLAEISGPIVGIGFGATFGSAKTWSTERFSKLIRKVKEWGSPVLLGGPLETPMAKEILKLSGFKIHSFVGQTDLPTLAAIFTKLAVYITNDTGPMHLAALMNTPTVALFGPTAPDETKPIGSNVKVIYHKQECAPCWLRECPKQHECMTAIGVEEVESVVKNLVEKTC